MPTIQVKVRNVYGQDRIYPANEAAEVLAHIAGTKTLTVQNLVSASLLGCATEFVEGDSTCAALLAYAQQVRETWNAVIASRVRS